jgi:hypothetical protein
MAAEKERKITPMEVEMLKTLMEADKGPNHLDHMTSLPSFSAGIPDPRRAQGRRHRLGIILAISAGAILCGMRGYKAISDWTGNLGQKARGRLVCRLRKRPLPRPERVHHPRRPHPR